MFKLQTGMPAALDVDHDKVRAVAMVVGVREAARQFELSEEMVCKWSQREGWFKHQELVQSVQLKVQEKQGVSTAVRKSQTEVLQALGPKSKLLAAKLGQGTLKAIQRKATGEYGDDKLIALAPTLNTTVNTLAKVHDWGNSSGDNRTLVNINLGNVRLPEV